MGRVLGDVAALLIAAGILAVLGSAAVLAGVLWIRRAWRRRRVALALRLNGLAVGAAVAGVQWLRTRPAPDRRWWLLQRARRDLLRAGTFAEHAVVEAKAAGASLGDLEGLTRRLRRAAVDVDRSLRVAQRAGSTEPVEDLLAQARRLTDAARQLHRSAAASLVGLHRDATDELVRHVALEERAIFGGAR